MLDSPGEDEHPQKTSQALIFSKMGAFLFKFQTNKKSPDTEPGPSWTHKGGDKGAALWVRAGHRGTSVGSPRGGPHRGARGISPQG